MSHAINREGWVRDYLPNTGYLVYSSTHKTVLYENRSFDKWMIVKEPNGYMLYVFMFGGYHPVKGFQPQKRLKDVQYYCDVEVERFNNGQY